MRFLLTIAAVAISSIAFVGAAMAQAAGGVQSPGSSTLYSTNPNGVQIQGNTTINASGRNVNTTAIGKGNLAESNVGAIGGGTQIQGNTGINASSDNTNTTAVGEGNKAKATVGGIGK